MIHYQTNNSPHEIYASQLSIVENVELTLTNYIRGDNSNNESASRKKEAQLKCLRDLHNDKFIR